MSVFIVVLSMFFSITSSFDDVNKANSAYKNGDYETAEALFRQALEKNPEDSRLYYNLATTLAAQGKSEEALDFFNQFKTMTETAADRSKADYNIGKSYAEQEKWAEATEAFKSALMQNPNDTEAKHNYELSRQKLQEQQQQQEQNQDQQNQDQQQDEKENDKKEQDQQQNEQQQNQDQQNQDQQQDEQQQQQQQSQPQQQQVSKEEAKKLLEALDKKEKDLLKQFKKKQTKPTKKNAKDW